MRVFAVLVMLALPPCNAFAFGPSRCGVQGFFSRPQPVHQSALRPARAGVLGVRADVTVTLATPLGIVFEEVEPGQAKGLVVKDLVPGGNAERDGKILVGDKLIATSAVVLDSSNQPFISLGSSSTTTNWKREMIPCGSMDFSSIMSAIQSNTGRYGYKDVRLTVRRTDNSVFRSTDTITRKPSAEDAELDLPLKVRPDPWNR